MLELNGPDFMRAIMQIQMIETILDNRPGDAEWKALIEPATWSTVANHLDSLEASVNVIHGTLTLMSIRRTREALQAGTLTWEGLGRHMIDLKARLQDELSLVRLFVLDPRMAHYLMVGEDLVGPAINTHFPSAIFDIEEAAKCLAVLRPTASAFHSMRALEVAIRALARFLDIPDPIKPAERNWNVLLKTIKDGIDVKYPTSADKGPHTEGARIEGLYANLDSIRNPWRNATMHNENIYQIEEADHILKCVNVLFIKCAEMFDEQGEAI
ncbi:hypothetical protein [Brevundimonas sp. TWP2-3-2]|uniref:hypothetical protein n=1 Tax=Brevundimonas sp. TWP2-3-2 TaxID=2804648 RepID=UPI003CEE174A